MRSFPRLLLPAALLLALAACSDDEPEVPAGQETEAETGSGAVAIEAPRPGEANEKLQLLKEEPKGVQSATGPVMDASVRTTLQMHVAGGHRKPAHLARDPYRHPLETLEFFGIQQGMRVVEITPGAGYWTELLGPTMKNLGTYVMLVPDDSASPGELEELKMLRARMAAQRNNYSRVEVIRFNPAQPVFGPPASADLVMTFRNAHNWVADGRAPAYFKALANVLKPGGVLGLEDHRAPEGEPTDGSRGYVTEEQIIQLAAQAGFALADKSEINANPKDTRDHPQGVWNLPPTYAGGDKDRDKYTQIGESDRMTLKFIKQ